MREKTKKRISVIAMLAAVLAGLLIQLFLPGLGVRAEAAEEQAPDYINPFPYVDITKTSARADLVSIGEDKYSNSSFLENIFITMCQYYDLEGNLRSYLYFNYVGDINADLSVSISTSVSNSNYKIDEEFSDYVLTLINKDEENNWCKFEILDLPNLDFTTRRYYLDQLKIDGISSFLIDEVFVFNGVTNTSIKVWNREIETIDITDKKTVMFCYGKDSSFANVFGFEEVMAYNNVYEDSFFVCFNTDKKIDDLLEVEVRFQEFEYSIFWKGLVPMYIPHSEGFCNSVVTGTNITSLMRECIVLDSDFNKMEYKKYDGSDLASKVITPEKYTTSSTNQKWFSKYETEYSFDTIFNLKDYKASKGDEFEFSKYADDYTWIVHFGTYTKEGVRKAFINDYGIPNDGMAVSGTSVCDVAIFRLKFVTDGVVHNCYAVDIPSDAIEGNASKQDDPWDDFYKIMSIVVVVIILSVLAPAVKPITEGIISIVSIPFKFIASLFNKKK